jgi:hypothetical protein
LLPFNIAYGLQFRDWYHNRVDPFMNDVKAGLPAEELAYEGYFGTPDPLLYLHDDHIGVFAHLQENAPIGPGREIDGLTTGGQGWFTLGGRASSGVLQSSGSGRVLRWTFDTGEGAVAVLGHSFPVPQDWRGAGAIALTVEGQGSGRIVDVRLAATTGSGRVDRYDTTFVDDRPGTHTLAIPWDGFAHVAGDGHFDPQGPVPMQHVVALMFGVSGPPQGSLTIQRIALEAGHGPLSWPSWSASNRRSLPPWR